MLPMVRAFMYETGNTAGANWNPGRSLRVLTVGSLNDYLSYFDLSYQYPPYSLTCSIIPWPAHCWSAKPDWIIATNVSLRFSYGIYPGSGWAYLTGTQTDAIEYAWW